jgi:hypothetical protein
MEHVIEIVFGAVAALVGGVIVHLLAHDISDRLPAVSRKLISLAARRMPTADRDRFETEWLAHLWECEGHISKLRHGIECFLFAPKIARLCGARENGEPCGVLFAIDDKGPVYLNLPTAMKFLRLVQKVKKIPNSQKSPPNDALAKRLAEELVSEKRNHETPEQLRQLISEIRQIDESAEPIPEGEKQHTVKLTLVDRFGRQLKPWL